MSSSRLSLLDLSAIFVTLIGVVIIIFNENIGLTILFGGIILYASTIVRNRLKIIGAEAFALGSIIVWLGFFMASLPVIAFAWSLFDLSVQVILLTFGSILIILGFTTEYYDLNIRFYNFIKVSYARLSELLEIFKDRVFRSIWTVSSAIFLVWGIIGFIVPSTVGFLPKIFPTNMWARQISLLLISLLFLVIEIREIILLFFTSLFKSFGMILEVAVERLKDFPEFIRRIRNGIASFARSLADMVSSLAVFSTYNIYLFSFLGFIFAGFFGIINNDDILGSIAIILLIFTMVSIIKQRQEEISSGISRIQQETYRRSIAFRNLIRRSASGNCPQCGLEVTSNNNLCQNCNRFIPKCMVCRNHIYAGEEVLSCTECDYSGHVAHIENWISIKAVCPNCRVDWK